MEGVIDSHLRALYAEVGGISHCVSEFVRVNDLPVPAKTFLRLCPELKNGPELKNSSKLKNELDSSTIMANLANGEQRRNSLPVHVQLLGSNPQTMAESACVAVALGAPAIDLNFGCPAKTVNRSRGGAALLDETQLLSDIVASVRKAVPLQVPVTAKIRLGFERRDSYLDNAVAIAEAGASELCVHARSRADGYAPPAYWHHLAEIKQAVDIPIIANGEIWSVDNWRQCQAESGCDDFMLGRGLLACPDLALQIRAYTAGQDYQPMAWVDILLLLERFYHETKDAYPRRFLGNRLKQWLFYLKLCYPEAKTFFASIKRYRDDEQFSQAFLRSGG